MIPLRPFAPFVFSLFIAAVIPAAEEKSAAPDPQISKAAQAAPLSPAKPLLPEVEKLGETKFKLGEIHFDSATREVRIPAWINMDKGMIEFPLVHREGRTHEAIFATEITPLQLETVLRLLRYETSQESIATYPGVDLKDPPPNSEWPEPVYAAPNPKAHVQIFALFKDKEGKESPVDIRTLLYRSEITQNESEDLKKISFESLAPHWVFTGSTEPMDQAIQPLGGSFVAIREESQSCINAPGKPELQSREWFADPEKIPEPETRVTLLIRPVTPSAPQP